MIITQLEFTDSSDYATAERVAMSLGYTGCAYTSTSSLIGLFCLPAHKWQKSGCVIKTKEFGFMFVQDLEDLGLADELETATH